MKSKLTQLCAGRVPSDVEFADVLTHINDPDDAKIDGAAVAEAADEDRNVDDDDALVDPELLQADERVRQAMTELEQAETTKDGE